jgi:DNA-binding response OmpR family regulator
LPHQPRVLILDDDPSHLKLYAWILERQGFTPVPVLVGTKPPTFEDHPDVDLVVLDYTYRTGVKATEVAEQVRKRWAEIQIIVLSDMMWMPDDIKGTANSFVRKGEPEQLIAKVAELTGFAANAAGV